MSAGPGRPLHPGAWWLWALGLATAASRTTNPLLLLLIVAVASLVVAARRPDTVWGRGFRYYLWAGLLVVVLRVLFRVILGGVIPGQVLFTLPEVTLPAWMAGVTLGGPVTVESLVGGLYDGLRLATMLVCVGAANALADAKRLLRSVPRALHELGAALVVAVGFAPQLVESVRRVHRAQRLRGHTGGGRHLVRRTLMPVLEGATTRALVLAGSMEWRGYGRDPTPARRRRLTTALVLAGLTAVAVGTYGLLDAGSPALLGVPVLAAGLALASAGFAAAGRGTGATVYRPDPWEGPEWLVAACGIVAAGGVLAAGWMEPAVLFPSPTTWPPVSILGTVAVSTAALPAVPRLVPAPRQVPAEGTA